MTKRGVSAELIVKIAAVLLLGVIATVAIRGIITHTLS